MQHMSEKGTGGSPRCCRGLIKGCEWTRYREPGSIFLLSMCQESGVQVGNR